MVGCASSAAAGGSCKSGAAGAAFSMLATPAISDMNGLAGAFAAAVVGGAGSRIGGGSFANGALTGAFGYLFNDLGSLRDRGYAGFSSQDAAALDALNRANPLSIRDNLEYGGIIYKNSSGRYEYTGPAQGTDDGYVLSSAPNPAGTTSVGFYHTHGDYSTRGPDGRAVRTANPALDSYGSNNFSSTDLRIATTLSTGVPGYKAYLGTPNGTFKVFNPSSGRPPSRFP